jgi:hypothetical protein
MPIRAEIEKDWHSASVPIVEQRNIANISWKPE